MIPKNFDSMVITTCIETTIHTFSKKKKNKHNNNNKKH